MEANSSSTTGHGSAGSDPSILQTFDNLYPSLLQCFAIILVGYCTARFGFISPTSSKGIGIFVSLVALPALLFKSMVELDFSRVNWPFLYSTLIGKSVVFFTVMLFTLVLVRPTNLGKAGIYAIFSVQSNDFALGYPLLKAMYQDLHPEFINYVYLIAPVSLVCLNPIGFVLMEIHKQRNTRDSLSKVKVAIATVKGVVTNPIVFMTFIGILGNFVFSQKVPAILDDILGALGQAFLASALFYLGVKMVGNMKTKMGSGLMVPLLLIAAKILLLPLVTREAIQVLNAGNGTNDTDCWSMFGFLYGTFPTAPTVAIFAAKFGIEEQAMTSSMVMCTFLSAPVMFISAQMSVLGYISKLKIENLLKDTMLDVSSVSIPFGVWVIAMFFLARRHRIYPHNFTLCLVVCQLLSPLTSILSVIDWDSQYWYLIQSILFFIGCWGSRCWTAMVALSLCLVRCRGDKAVTRFRGFIYMFGFGLPTFLCGIVVTLLHYSNELHVHEGPFLLYYFMTRMPSMVCSFILLSVCVVITVVSLVRLQRCDRYCKCPKKNRCAPNKDKNEETSLQDQDPQRCSRCVRENETIDRRTRSCCQSEEQKTAVVSCSAGEGVMDIESLDESTCLIQEAGGQQTYTEEIEAMLENQSVEMDVNVDEYLQGEKHQLACHVTMLVILLITMVLALFLTFWSVLQESTSGGIFIALQTVDAFCIFGQSFVVFACFGLEKQLVIIPFLKRWRKLWYGVEGVTLPKVEDLDPVVVHFCDQFKRYHKQRCQRLLASDKRYRLRKYKSVFRGDKLVNWLLEVGLASDRHAAVRYGNSLILGRVIRHVTESHFFYDSPYLYQFC